MIYGGIDIGGTKCAVLLGRERDGVPEILSKERFETLTEYPYDMLTVLKTSLFRQLAENGMSAGDLKGIGISCGGPLCSKTGVIMSPPNLPLWNNIPVTNYFEREFGVLARLQNDANACAVAEWKFGAGKGSENMVFLTFGTGFGAGLILNSHLYCGTLDMAGEIGHIRACDGGPEGYGKKGSYEAFCSGGGIARLCRIYARRELERGKTPRVLEICGGADKITAKVVADLADEGDALCIEVYRESGRRLGFALSMLADLLNPQVIIIGSVFTRSRNLLWESCDEVMRAECLPAAYQSCRVEKSALGDSVGDVAALAVATGNY